MFKSIVLPFAAFAMVAASCVRLPEVAPTAPDSGKSIAGPSATMTTPAYPAAPRSDVVDDYFGTNVADPYRTLEDHQSPATQQWAREENALTEQFLDRPERAVIKDRLRELFDFAHDSTPFRKKNLVFYSRNEGLQDQPVFYVQQGAEGSPRALLDPNSLSADGTVAVKVFSVSDDANLLAYSISRSGSDWEEVYVRDIRSGKDLSDKLAWAKFTDLTWTPDSKGFFYNRYSQPGTVQAGEEHYFSKLMYHLIGSNQSADKLIYSRPREREVTFDGDISHDGRYLIITAHNGSSDNSEIYFSDRQAGDAQFKPLFTGFAHIYEPSDVIDHELYVRTNDGAARQRVIAVDLRSGTQREVVPQSADTLDSIEIAGGRIVAHYLHNATSVLKVFGRDGTALSAVPLPGLGSVTAMNGETDGNDLYIGYDSFIQSPTQYRYDVQQGTLTAFSQSKPPFDPSGYETEQVWYPSKDGTKVSMFLSHRKGLKKSSDTPVFLYGYGGFNIAMTPAFNPVHFYFMERGGIFAVANLRGGSEYGEAWHEAGMLEKKQNVFDDFAAAAQWLVSEGYTSRKRLAASGRSNGGLLAAASLVQHPDLFGVVVVQVPVVDMLRYHLFTVARFWIPEYGSSENPEQFKFLYAYSPLHNVKKGTKYPPALITTADTDDRVDPGPAKKFAATLQEAQGGPAPILIRIDSKAGHASGSFGGAGKPVSKLIAEWADIWTFVFYELGVS
ncbi:MAG: prolyl oligopeptidase family serine peptidase [Acidobacteriota bacterium]